MASFEEILNRKSSELKPPQAFPVGSYHCLIDGPLTPGKSSQKQTDFLQVKFKILNIKDDVDAAEAAEQQVIGKTITSDYYITDTAAYRLREMLVNDCGIQDDEGTPEEKGLKELVSLAPGNQVIVKLKHELSQDGKRVFHRVESTAHV